MTPYPAPHRPYRVLPLTTVVKDESRVLARVRFTQTSPGGDDPRDIAVPLALLAGEAGELWLSESPVEFGRSEAVAYSENGEILLGQLHIGESALADRGADVAVFDAYERIERLLAVRGYPHWLRTWNYIARILDGAGDRERYRLFNLGRHRALSQKPGFEARLPAATAIGTQADGVLIYFLAGRRPGQPVENPRQLNAWRYPSQYGPRSPSFSRATLLDWSDGAELLVSGTASVVGHESRHPDDVGAQLTEALANLDSLRAEAERLSGFAPHSFKPQAFKLYVVDRAHLAQLQPRLTEALKGAYLSCLEGAICRNDLRVEIEGCYRAD